MIEDLMVIKQRYYEYLWRNVEDAEEYLSLLQNEGDLYRWSDLNCQDSNTANWQGHTFLNRTRLVLQRYGRDMDKELFDKLAGAFRYWLKHDFQNTNWWYMQIGVPSALCDLTIMLEDELTEEELDKAVSIIQRGSFSHNQHAYNMTGANLIWGVWTTVKHALLVQDCELLKKAVNRASYEFEIADGLKEGVKPDYSFFQHGPQHYTMGYGRSFTESLSPMVYILSGTEYQFSKEILKLLVDFLLEGQVYMIRNGTVDYLAIGREYCRPEAYTSIAIRRAAELYSKTSSIPRKANLEAFITAYDNGTPYIKETKFFEDSLVLTHQRQNFYISIKGLNNTLIGSESLNGENILGYNLSYGTNMCFLSTGKEYENMPAVWDYSMMPGTTSYIESEQDVLNRLNIWNSKIGLNDKCYASIKNGKGAMTMDFDNRDMLTGTVTYIVFDEGVIVLGTNICCHKQNNDKEIWTTINQCVLEDNFNVQVDGNVITNGSFLYINLDPERKLEYTYAKVTGSWRRNNKNIPTETVAVDVLKIGISHGTSPKGSKFSYAVIDASKKLEVENIVNTPLIQGVEFGNGGHIFVFHKAGEYTLKSGKTIKSDGGVVVNNI